jgi:tRNA U38,U39,U40 pseudouridine synthase TruA
MDISGSGFLYHMVRIIVGTLVEVGRGAISVDDVARILAARDRTLAGPTLDASGLRLMWIQYPGDEDAAAADLAAADGDPGLAIDDGSIDA